MIGRRGFLRGVAAGMCARAASAASTRELIRSIERSVIWRGRRSGTVWFHPRACLVPESSQPTLLMTVQDITGSDVFGPVHWSESKDFGATWSDPQPIPGMGRRETPDHLQEGTCDVVPEYHPRTKTVLAMGHNVYYGQDGKLARPSEQRWPIYIVRGAKNQWGMPKRLNWDHPEASAIYSAGCAQRITLSNGDILVPLSLGPLGRIDRGVCTVRCSFDGQDLRVIQSGNILRNPVRRGLLEPSLAFHDGRYFMTIRAEDDHGYVATSTDGLQWPEKKAWRWDDETPLTLSTTQQRWVTHSDGLFLAYTRKDATNVNVMRWRTPLYIAQVDTKRLCLIRKTEQIALPIDDEAIKRPELAAHLGNFHTTAISRYESLITVGEVIPKTFRGDTLQAKIRWSQPNRDLA